MLNHGTMWDLASGKRLHKKLESNYSYQVNQRIMWPFKKELHEELREGKHQNGHWDPQKLLETWRFTPVAFRGHGATPSSLLGKNFMEHPIVRNGWWLGVPLFQGNNHTSRISRVGGVCARKPCTQCGQQVGTWWLTIRWQYTKFRQTHVSVWENREAHQGWA